MQAMTSVSSRRTQLAVALLALALGLVMLVAAGPTARAANGVTIVVNTTTDPAGPGCTGGTCSLRQAITVANGDTNDIIHVPTIPSGAATKYTLAAASNSLTVSAPMTIAGDDPRLVAVDGGNANSVSTFDVTGGGPGLTVIITGLTIQDGLAPEGGGIFNHRTPLVLGNDIIANNVADDTQSGGQGAGVANVSGTLLISSTTFSNNVTKANGVANNGRGGGIWNLDDGAGSPLTMVNDTFNGNSASLGGAIYTDQVGSLNNVTISANSAVDIPGVAAPANHGGGGIYEATSTRTVTLHNTIVSKDLSGDCAPAGRFTSTGHNIDGDNSCGLTAAGDKPSTDPVLAALAFNAPEVIPPTGFTDTMAIAAGSPALDTADNTNCPTADERGETRPQNGTCDIGAFELPFVAPTLPKSGAGPSQPLDLRWLGAALVLFGVVGAAAVIRNRA